MVGLTKRLAVAVGKHVAALLAVVLISFVLLRLAADPGSAIATGEHTRDQAGELRSFLGGDAPLPVQFGNYVGRLGRGDLGQFSIGNREPMPVLSQLLPLLPATVMLVLAGLVIGLAIALPLGLACGTRGWAGLEWLVSLVLCGDWLAVGSLPLWLLVGGQGLLALLAPAEPRETSAAIAGFLAYVMAPVALGLQLASYQLRLVRRAVLASGPAGATPGRRTGGPGWFASARRFMPGVAGELRRRAGARGWVAQSARWRCCSRPRCWSERCC
jgi:ABC-type dipeptide/oligopeptide/nickel transport system permease component